jgi:uncharacterized RDD family membrane protein YckC
VTGPPAAGAAVTGPPPAAARESLQGHFAGFVSRFAGYIIDVIVTSGLFTLGLAGSAFVVSIIARHPVNWNKSSPGVGIIFAAWLFAYYAYSWGAFGKTAGMALLGVRVVRTNGADLSGWRAIARTLAFPLSFLFLGIGFLPILFQHQRRALHDLIADTAVIYAWDARAARLRFLARR